MVQPAVALESASTPAAASEEEDPDRPADEGDSGDRLAGQGPTPRVSASARGPLAFIFLLALALRLAFVFGVDEPLRAGEQYAAFTGGLSIATHQTPLSFVWHSDDWHTWAGSWTGAPLYPLFVGAVLGVVGSLRALQVLQCLLGAGMAVAVASLGQRLAGRRGLWAGVGWALYWPAIGLSSKTLADNLHGPLLLAGMLLLAAPAVASWRRAGSAGLLLGLAALARPITLPFVVLVAIWHAWRGGAAGRSAAVMLLFGAALGVMPWVARNALVTGDPVLIETAAAWHFWNDNVDGATREAQAGQIGAQPTAAGASTRALDLGGQGIGRSPGRFAARRVFGLAGSVAPTALTEWLVLEHPATPWRRVASLALGDLVWLVAALGFLAFAVGRPGSAGGTVRTLALLWVAVVLCVCVVVLHTDQHDRRALLPVLLAGAAAASWPADRTRRFALTVGCAALLGLMLGPIVLPAVRAAGTAWQLRAAAGAVAAGDLDAAEARVRAASLSDPQSARPWTSYGGLLVKAGHEQAAARAYATAREHRPDAWTARVAEGTLLWRQGHSDQARERLEAAHSFSWTVDPWVAQELAWRELPPEQRDVLELGWADYGAVRNFLYPRRDHRWTRATSWLRLWPRTDAERYLLTIEMGSPEPSPFSAPDVRVEAGDGSRTLTLARQVRSYEVPARRGADGFVVVRIDAPTWSRPGLPAERGVRVERVRIVPADS